MKKDFVKKASLFRKRVRKIVEDADVVIEILDARFPQQTRAHEIERLAKSRGKPIIFLINKSDLVSKKFLKKEKEKLMGIAPSYSISAKDRSCKRLIKMAINRHAKRFPIKIGLIGYPNVGKSSIANLLKGRKAAAVAPIPGFTRGVQWVKISKEILLLDSPGIIPVDEKDEMKLALLGAIEADKLEDAVSAAVEIIKPIMKTKLNLLQEKYKIRITKRTAPEKVLEKIAIVRGRLLKGAKPDTDAAAKIVIRDWYKGKLKF